jgi:hypothetical protein
MSEPAATSPPTRPATASTAPLSTDRLVEVLDEVLDACRRGRRVADVVRRPAEYYSSHRLEDLLVRLDDGTVLSVISKDLSPGAMLEAAASVKPPFLLDPMREPWAYQILDAFDVEGPRCVGYYANEPARQFILFLEKADGVPLWQVGDPAVWRAAARWSAVANGQLRTLAGAPTALSQNLREPCGFAAGPRGAGRSEIVSNAASLVAYTAEYYALWPRRVAELVIGRNPADPRAAALAPVLDRYGQVIDRLTRLPKTMIHGEFYASNILAGRRTSGGDADARIIPVDWEMAGIGPGLMDLADLTAGNWPEAERQSMVDAYRAAQPPELSPPPEQFDAALDACRLHKAMQWLGWAADWQPPKEHRHDWIAEALRLGKKLGLR